jgi:cell wall assembly regulator SMI1
MPTDLERSLDAIRAHAKKVVPKAAASLRRSAGATALKRLEKALGRRVPADLAQWFGQHDGQHFLSEGLDPTAPAMTWLSVADAIRERAELIAHPEKMLPWNDAWLPIVGNGGGDFYVYVTSGRDAGAILFYLHDARRRPRIARSLTVFAASVAKSLAARDKPKATGPGGALVGPLVACGAPSTALLKRAEVGTIYYRRALPYRSFFYWIFVKVTPTAWAAAYGKFKRLDDFGFATALAKIQAEVSTTAAADWREPLDEIRERLSNQRCFPRGIDALKGRDPRRDPYFARKRGQLAPLATKR